MTLIEIISVAATDPKLVDDLETMLVHFGIRTFKPPPRPARSSTVCAGQHFLVQSLSFKGQPDPRSSRGASWLGF
jgi:hypothetical protein